MAIATPCEYCVWIVWEGHVCTCTGCVLTIPPTFKRQASLVMTVETYYMMFGVLQCVSVHAYHTCAGLVCDCVCWMSTCVVFSWMCAQHSEIVLRCFTLNSMCTIVLTSFSTNTFCMPVCHSLAAVWRTTMEVFSHGSIMLIAFPPMLLTADHWLIPLYWGMHLLWSHFRLVYLSQIYNWKTKLYKDNEC